MRNWLNAYDASDVLLTMGAVLIVYGVSLLSKAAAWIVAGTFMIVYAYLLSSVKAKNAYLAKLSDQQPTPED